MDTTRLHNSEAPRELSSEQITQNVLLAAKSVRVVSKHVVSVASEGHEIRGFIRWSGGTGSRQNKCYVADWVWDGESVREPTVSAHQVFSAVLTQHMLTKEDRPSAKLADDIWTKIVLAGFDKRFCKVAFELTNLMVARFKASLSTDWADVSARRLDGRVFQKLEKAVENCVLRKIPARTIKDKVDQILKGTESF